MLLRMNDKVTKLTADRYSERDFQAIPLEQCSKNVDFFSKRILQVSEQRWGSLITLHVQIHIGLSPDCIAFTVLIHASVFQFPYYKWGKQ